MCNNFITSQLVSNIIILPFCQEKGNDTYLKKTLKIINTNAFLINKVIKHIQLQSITGVDPGTIWVLVEAPSQNSI